jgi:hypothetical protein
MKTSFRTALAAAALAGVGLAHTAPAAPSTLFGDELMDNVVDVFRSQRRDTFTDPASPEAIALDKAVTYFDDPSSSYAEDLTDFAKAVKTLRKVFGTDAANPDQNKAAFVGGLNNAVAGQSLILIGIGNAAYAKDGILTRVKISAEINRASLIANEQKRLAKFAALARKYYAHAKKKRIDLTEST